MFPFDAVIMLTWSDWANEPRGNRYHYAARFQNHLPVFFLQHRYQLVEQIEIEETEFPNLKIVNVSVGLNETEISSIRDLLKENGIENPLFWIYDSLHYQKLIDEWPQAFRVYHATEDYLTETNGWTQNNGIVSHSVINLIEKVDLVVACSEGVASAIRSLGHYQGRIITVNNGCDAEFFIESARSLNSSNRRKKKKTAIFQGGINARLDYNLINKAIQMMPDWEFVFCGREQEYALWETTKSFKNVTWYDQADMDLVAQHMCDATVGIIPFIQDSWINNSYPLKALEYVACGLPVASVPIKALEEFDEDIKFFTNEEEFKELLETLALTRYDDTHIARREKIALENSYNNRFQELSKGLIEAYQQGIEPPKKLNIAVLFDNLGSLHVNCIREHIQAFKKFSSHQVTFIPANTSFWPAAFEDSASLFDFSHFDAVVLNYSIRTSVPGHLNEAIFQALCDYQGIKIAYIQDEYEGIQSTWNYMEKIGFDVVYTCVPLSDVDKVYPPERFPNTKFLPTLTGYVPDKTYYEKFHKNIKDKTLDIFYRGRQLPEIYGKLGYEKFFIAEEIHKKAAGHALKMDVETRSEARIYGDEWFEYLSKARVTLGTESGASIFDFDGEIQRGIDEIKAQNPEISFDDLFDQYLHAFDGIVTMNQISPKIFEAILVKTALVLFEGSYSNILEPDKHFIPLKKDFSNFAEVVEKIKSDDYIEQLTTRAYQDIILSQAYTYERFMKDFEHDLQTLIIRKKTNHMVYSQLVSFDNNAVPVEVMPLMPQHLSEFKLPVMSPFSLKQFSADRMNEVNQLTIERLEQKIEEQNIELKAYEETLANRDIELKAYEETLANRDIELKAFEKNLAQLKSSFEHKKNEQKKSAINNDSELSSVETKISFQMMIKRLVFHDNILFRLLKLFLPHRLKQFLKNILLRSLS